MVRPLADVPLAVVRGGGELGTGIAHALCRAGLRLLVLDRALPGALRLRVAFATAAVERTIEVEGVTAVHCAGRGEVEAAWAEGQVAVWTLDLARLGLGVPDVLIDARMRSLTAPMTRLDEAALVIGVGPGFEAGRDVHVVLESNRGPRLGQVVRAGFAEEHTGVPGEVEGLREERILRAPRPGRFVRILALGDFVEAGDVVGEVDGAQVSSRLRGMIRGLKLTGVAVGEGHKVGDVDPRRDVALLSQMTDKAQAVGRGALEAVIRAGLLSTELSSGADGDRVSPAEVQGTATCI